MIDVTFQNIQEAHERIKPFIKQTRVLNFKEIDEVAGCHIYFKCENEQRAQAFKFRGATNAVQSLSDEKAQRGVCPHSSGNHAAALALAAKAIDPTIKIYAGEPLGADDAFRSMIFGQPLPMENPQTVADGLRTSLSERTFSIIKSNVSEILIVEDVLTLKAQELFHEVSGTLIEPSSAVPFAAIIKNKEKFKGKKVGLIISGGNVTHPPAPSL